MAGFVLTWAVAAIAMQEASAPAPTTPPAPAKPTASAPADNSTTVTGVTVTTERPQVQTQIDRRTYSVANDLQAQTGSIADALRNIPSVQVDVNGNLSLRGDANVTVLLDGQPSAQFTGDNLAQALQSLPANRIDKVEVITNPSAAFRADGSGGIINLVTKKVTTPGPAGSVQAMIGDDGRGRLSLVATRGGAKLRLNGDLAFNHLIQNVRQDNRRSQLDSASQTLSESRELVSDKATGDLVNAHAGAEYDIDKRTRWSGDLRAQYGVRNLNGGDGFVTRDAGGDPVLDFDRTYGADVTQSYVQGLTSWRRKYAEGHDLTFNGTYERFQTDTDRTDETLTNLPAGEPPFADRVTMHSLISQGDFKADYNRPLAGMTKLQLGYEAFYAVGAFVNDSGQSVGGAPAPIDPAQHDRFEGEALFNEAYVTYERPFGKFTALAGLRGQVANIDLTRVTQSVRYGQNYGHLFPTLHLNYSLGEGRRLTASYSKRVNRPVFADVNPYVISTSAQSAVQGNPNLKPELTDSYEFGYEHRQGPSIVLATFYYRRTSDAFTVIGTDLGDGVLLAQRANAGERQNAGLELVKTGKLTAKLTYNLSANIYWSQIQAPGLGFPIDRSGTTGFGRANLNWQATDKDFV
ncbi:MAG TPA: outer membrane beta-barrel family protein, partial [Caulobacteraceae bacterium]|nr:outer membrane beta-barrel family protein [Caulobacteraceae bacterium]